MKRRGDSQIENANKRMRLGPSIKTVFENPNPRDIEELESSLRDTLHNDMKNCSFLIYQLSTYLKKNGIRPCMKFSLSNLGSLAFDSLQKHLTDALQDEEGSIPCFEAWLSASHESGSGQSIAHLLHNCSVIAKSGLDLIALESKHIETLFSFLVKEKNVTNRALGESFFALGVLAREGKIADKIDTSYLHNVLEKRQTSSVRGLDEVHLIFLGIGLLAEYDKLTGWFEQSVLQKLLTKPDNLLHTPSIIGSKAISMYLCCLSWLSKSHRLRGDVNVPELTKLFRSIASFSVEDLDIRDISLGIQSMAILTKEGVINEFSCTAVFENLFEKLLEIIKKESREVFSRNTPEDRRALLSQGEFAQTIRNSLYGVGKIAVTGHAVGFIRASLLQELFAVLESCKNLKELDISKSLLGTGLMAKAGLIKGSVDPSDVFRQFDSFRYVATNSVSYALEGIGLLAEAEVITGNIQKSELTELLGRLQLTPPDYLKLRHVSSLFNHIALLIKAGMIEKDAVDIKTLDWLLETIDTFVRDDMSIRDLKDSLEGFIKLKPYVMQDFSTDALARVRNLIWAVLKKYKSDQTDNEINDTVLTIEECMDKDIADLRVKVWNALDAGEILPMAIDSIEEQNDGDRENDSERFLEKSISESIPDNPYKGLKIQDVLNARIKGYSTSCIRVIESNSIANTIGNFLNSDQAKCMQHLLLPISLENQWVGLLAALQDGKIKHLFYFNSCKNDRDNEYMKKIETLLLQKELIAPEIKVIKAPIVMEHNIKNSTAILMIENFYCHLKGVWWPPLNGWEISGDNVQAMKGRQLSLCVPLQTKAGTHQSQAGFFAQTANNQRVDNTESLNRKPSVEQRITNNGF